MDTIPGVAGDRRPNEGAGAAAGEEDDATGEEPAAGEAAAEGDAEVTARQSRVLSSALRPLAEALSTRRAYDPLGDGRACSTA